MTLKEFYDFAIQEGANENTELYVKGHFQYDNFHRRIDESKVEANEDNVTISLGEVGSY